MQPVQAVIFDFGMVLSQPQSQERVHEMAQILDVPPAEFAKAYWHDRHAYDIGQFDGPAYWAGIAGLLGKETSSRVDELIDLDIRSWMQLNEDMMPWVQAVRAAGLRTAILSNMPFEHRNWMVDKSGWLSQFDSATFSCDLGIGKPDAAIYEHCLNVVGTPAQHTVFLDDREENIHGAKRLGLHALHFTTPAETLTGIHEKFHLPAFPAC